MKRYRTLGILVGVLVIICVATLVVKNYEAKQEEIKNTGEAILEISPDSVTSLSWEYEEDSGLSFHKGEDGWTYDDDETFPVSEDKVTDILSHFESFCAVFSIENVEDYSQYGLDNPNCTLTIATDTDTYTIKVGDYSQMDEMRYVDIGDGNAYLVSDDPTEIVDSALSSMIQNDDTPGFEGVTDITFEGTENYTIDYLEDSGYSYSEDDVYYMVSDGSYLPLDKTMIVKYLNTITSLNLDEYVTYNVTEEELESYGLSEPELTVTVNYTGSEENGDVQTCIIHVGQNQQELAAAQEAEAAGEDAEGVTKYVRIGDSQIIYVMDAADYNILSAADYDSLRHKEVFWGDFSDVTQVDLTLEGTTHTLVAQKDKNGDISWYFQEDIAVEETAEEETSGETSEETEEAKEEAEPVDLSDFESALEALSADSFTQDMPAGKEELRFVLYLDDENFHQVEIVLYRQDGSNCLVTVDGQSVSFVTRSSAMELVEAVQAFVLNA